MIPPELNLCFVITEVDPAVPKNIILVNIPPFWLVFELS
jgi:hypothetical protein